AYPAPNSSTTQNGDYFIEAVEYTHSDLHDMIGVDTFLEGNIRQVLSEYEDGHAPNKMEDSGKDELEDKDSGLSSKTGLEVIVLNGKIKGKFLAENGVLVEDLQKFYESEVWVIGDYVIR